MTILSGHDMIGAKRVIYISSDTTWQARYFSERSMVENWGFWLYLWRDCLFNATFIVGSDSVDGCLLGDM